MAERPDPPRGCDLTRGVVRVVVLSPRADKQGLLQAELTQQGYVVHQASSLREGSERQFWSGADIVVFDWAPYERETPAQALEWIGYAAPEAAIIAVIDPRQPRDGVRALARHASALLFDDTMTGAAVARAMGQALRSLASAAEPAPPSRMTAECQAIVDRMVARIGGEGDA